jgi:hypothetical protein
MGRPTTKTDALKMFSPHDWRAINKEESITDRNVPARKRSYADIDPRDSFSRMFRLAPSRPPI